MADAVLPPLRQRRRVVALPRSGPRARPIAIGLLAFAGVMTGVFAATRPVPVDVASVLAASRTTLAAGDYNAARSNAQAALRTDPASVEGHLLLARVYLRLGEGSPALAELTRANELGVPAAELYHLVGEARLLAGDPDGALADAARAGPAYAADATRVRARAHAAKGRRGEALAMLQELVRAAPNDARAWGDLGRIRFSGGEVGAADIAASRAATLAPGDPEALTLKAELVHTRYGPVASLPWFAAALARDAYHYPALIGYAATSGEVGRYRDMLAHTRRALLARPGDAQALYLQAVLAARAGAPVLARTMLSRAGGGVDAIPGAMLLWGALDHREGQAEQAIEHWRALVHVQPLNLRARALLGSALLRSGDPGGAAEVLRPIAERADADPYALTLAARAFERMGDRAAAARLLDRAMLGRQGVAAAFASDATPAALAAAAKGAPSDPTYAVGLIRGLADTGHADEALIAAQALVRATPGAPAALVALGDVDAVRGNWPEAAEMYRRAADLRFDEPVMLRLVDALGRAGRARDAAGALSLYLAQNPQANVARRLLGRWQMAAGDWNAAIETLEGVRARLGSGDAGLLADLAQAYAGDDDGPVARRYGAAAYALAPMNAGVVATYAAALEADGKAEAARQLRAKLAQLPRG
ncbi:tetratricopeptide repeat protein [uncultured Sphingomonas sp.]|uniref:tetratricopeptide repeat protein n=1 Tax=uncultured Sphingomonas sp. TaxID=158754 RepID=UPI0035CAF56F